MISRMNDGLPSTVMPLISHRYRVCMCILVACKRPIIIIIITISRLCEVHALRKWFSRRMLKKYI